MSTIHVQVTRATFLSVIVLCICGLFSVQVSAMNPQYTRAKIYFTGWNLGSERQFSLDWTRSHYQAYFYFKDPHYVSQFVEWLDLPKLQKIDTSEVKSSMLPWLVIDLYSGDKVSTYYSDGCYLISVDGKYFRPVTDEFRSRFNIYADYKVSESSTSLAKSLGFNCGDN